MKNTWGMPTLIELDGLEENVKLCVDLNLGFIELNMNLPDYQVENIDVDKIKYYQEKYDIIFTIHLPEEFNIANFNPVVNEAYIKTFKETVVIAKQIACPIINMHMNEGVYFTLPDKKIYLYEKYQKDFMNHIKEFSYIVRNELDHCNIRLAIENTGIFNQNHIKEAVEELLVYHKVGLTWDIGHDYSSNNKDYTFVMKNLDKIIHMHIHDAVGKSNHLPLGSGEIDMKSRLQVAKHNRCLCVLETKTVDGLLTSVDYLKRASYGEF